MMPLIGLSTVVPSMDISDTIVAVLFFFIIGIVKITSALPSLIFKNCTRNSPVPLSWSSEVTSEGLLISSETVVLDAGSSGAVVALASSSFSSTGLGAAGWAVSVFSSPPLASSQTELAGSPVQKTLSLAIDLLERIK